MSEGVCQKDAFPLDGTSLKERILGRHDIAAPWEVTDKAERLWAEAEK